MGALSGLTRFIRKRMASGTTSLFGQAVYPLADSLAYPGDPGLFGPGSVTWSVIGDAATFIGGIRALLIQACHPEVVAGVFDHSRYREDPVGRLSRTSGYITATAYGAMPEVRHAVEAVKGVHRTVRGASHRGRPYAADDPGLAAWVHNALTDSFLVSYQLFGPRPLPSAESDRFVVEQSRLGRMLGAHPLPGGAIELGSWLADHPDLAPSPGMQDAVAFLRKPPLGVISGRAYGILFEAAVASVPARLVGILGLRPAPSAFLAGRGVTSFLRWSLGSSPSWQLALIRTGARVPEGMFHRMPPINQPPTVSPEAEVGDSRTADGGLLPRSR